MNHFLEAAFSVVGVLFTFAKIVGVAKAFLFTEKLVEPYVKKILVNQRGMIIRQHVYMEHPLPLKDCWADQCENL